jgi:hypothetical protein
MIKRIGLLAGLLVVTALLAACIQPIADPAAAGDGTTDVAAAPSAADAAGAD